MYLEQISPLPETYNKTAYIHGRQIRSVSCSNPQANLDYCTQQAIWRISNPFCSRNSRAGVNNFSHVHIEFMITLHSPHPSPVYMLNSSQLRTIIFIFSVYRKKKYSSFLIYMILLFMLKLTSNFQYKTYLVK